MSISTHVLDAIAGRPAAGVSVTLSVRLAGDWVVVSERHTDAEGRIADFLGPAGPTERGTDVQDYQLRFDTGGYFGAGTFYPEVNITFRVSDAGAHHHVPLLISPYAYTTYRGS